MSKPSKPSSADQPDGEIPLGLNQIPLLKILSAQDRQQVLGEMTETRYEKGQYIFRQGDPTEYFHIVKEGSVKCVKSSLDGKECTLKVLMPGDLFCCDASAFDGASHPGTAQPMGDVSVLRMKKEAYFKMLRANPDAAMEVIRYLGNRLNEAQEKAKVLALDSADQRLASLLVGLAERSGVQDSQWNPVVCPAHAPRYGQYGGGDHRNGHPDHGALQKRSAGFRYRRPPRHSRPSPTQAPRFHVIIFTTERLIL